MFKRVFETERRAISSRKFSTFVAKEGLENECVFIISFPSLFLTMILLIRMV